MDALGHSRRDSITRLGQLALPLTAGVVSWLVPLAVTTGFGGALPDFDIYLAGARSLFTHVPMYADGPNQFVYPPIAAILFLPFLLGPALLWKILWTLASWAALIAVVRRLGLHGWAGSVAAAVAIGTATPVTMATRLGQVEILLTCLVILDLVPGPRVTDRRRIPLPAGWLVGLVTAIKLTPALFIVYLLLTRRWQAALTGTATAAGLTLVGFALLPGESLFYWGRLATTGSVGFASDPIYLDNQSFRGAILRLCKLAPAAGPVALVIAGGCIVIGLLAARRLSHRGLDGVAVVLVGLTTALASPVSWTHHFVWIVPLAVLLLIHRTGRLVAVSGTLLVVWLWLAPYSVLPAGGMKELDYTAGEILLSGVTPVLGLVVLVGALVADIGAGDREDRSAEVGEAGQVPGVSRS